MYMIADVQAQGGGKTGFGVPYSLLVDLSDAANGNVGFANDSGSDFALTGLATGAGGKLKYRIDKGVCMPVNETIKFESLWNEKVE